MQIRLLFTVQRFLRDFLKHKHIVLLEGISESWKHYFSRSQLIEVLESIYGDDLDKHINPSTATSAELLTLINNDLFLLEYVMEKLNDVLAMPYEIDRELLNQVLDQLGHQSHYLREKRIKDFDQYDLSNVISLLRQAGKLKIVYGIYNSSVSQEDVLDVTTPPSLFYDSGEEAEDQLARMVSEGECAQGERHVLSIELFIP